MAASSIGFPVCACAARAAPAVMASNSEAEKIARLGVNMPDLPVARDAPAGDRIVVLIGKRQNRRLLCKLAARGHEFGAGRLHIAGLVPGAALQRRWAAIPSPGHAEAGESLALHRLLKRCLRPPLTAVSRH